MNPARRLIVCAGCGRQAPHHAKDRCARCYPSTRARTTTCRDCGEVRPEHRSGRCAGCYRRAHIVVADCALCGERRPTRAGTCQRCKQRRRAGGGTCTGCARRVDRLWSGRCARCAKTSWTVGSCRDCLAWASSIAAGRCRACRDFARRGHSGQCRSCRRELAINRHGRCRLCTAGRRDTRLAGGRDPGVEPGERAGIQLFFGDMHGQRRSSPTSGDQTGPPTGGDDHDRRDHDGQLELFALPRVRHLDALLADWTRSPNGAALLTDLAGFAAARGWPPATTRAVGDGLARAAVAEPAFDLDDAASIAWLRRHYVPIGRLQEFLTAQGLQPQPTGPTTTTRWAAWLCAGLPGAMSTEVISWLEVLTATSGRGRARAHSTIDHYSAAVAPALTGFAARYDSLRQVSDDDITAQLEPLRGSARTATAVALRSLFATLKARRLIFADPTRRVHPGRFPRRPVLGLDPATRRTLLDQLTRADHRLVLLLAGVHALSRADITGLRLDDVDLPAGTVDGAGTLTVRGARRSLDQPTRTALASWLDERRRRWPATANPHLLISNRSALGLGPVSTGYLRGVTANLPVTLHQLRADRLLAHAHDTDGDALSLHRLFGLSADTAVRYCAELDPPTPEHTE